MKIDIAHTGKLANIPLSTDEKNKFGKQLSSVLDNFKKLSEVETSKVEETSQITGLVNVIRTDEVEESLSQSEALGKAKQVHNGMFVVPVILEEAIE